MKPGDKIPWETLAEAKASAEVPPKKLGASTVIINQAVIDLKAARQTGVSDFSTKKAWYGLAEALNAAVESLDFSAFDDLAKAWTNIEVDASVHTLGDRKGVCGIPKNKPRQPVTAAIVFAVDSLQILLDRAPTRQEILDFMSHHEAMRENIDVEASELSRQLKKLGWQKQIPKADELAS